MKKYYLHDGENQDGPFDIEELKLKKIKKDTPIWHEGIDDWTDAGKIEGLKPIFASSPPDFKPSKFSEPIQKKEIIVEEKVQKKRNFRKYAFIFVIGIILFFLVGSIINSSSGYGDTGDTYEEKVMTVAEIESSEPTKFLTAEGNYNNNFWGTKIKVHGTITNSATVASYKDAVVRITYYTKTETPIRSNDYTIYETFLPTSTTKFELKIDNYEDVNSIGWEVVSAVPK